MRIKCHGGVQEVGRSCFELNDKYLIDAGIMIGEIVEYPEQVWTHNADVKFPEDIDLSRIKAIFLSHSHLDHSGALPLFFHFGMKCPVFSTKQTKKTTKTLLLDALKVQTIRQENVLYSKQDIYNAMNSFKIVRQGKKNKFEDIKFTFYNAGHIPGSSMILFEIEGKKLLYSGDFNTIETHLIKQVKKIPKADILMMESTYGNREHTQRKQTEENFLGVVEEIIKRGGIVLIPAFAVGRAQEILLILNKRKFNVPVYLDGMAKDITKDYLDSGDVKNIKLLRKVASKTHFVKKGERKKLLQKQGIFVTTSGMLNGGPVLDYLKYIYNDTKSAVILTGYQAENTNGKMLLEKQEIMIDDELYKVKCGILFFDFSAHSGKRQLVEFVKKVNPKYLILEHGEPSAIKELSREFKDRKVYTPKIGDVIEID
ncbi:MAG: MBL fold metallo-hydrolase [Candidatus Aenigmatarchaeota archaeon]|nr:MAG: MBL fold metallo-hydrolase [Candidatus Aenigmarchaeota archaeon]